MAKQPVKFSVVDAFTESAFKGNPAAVCLLKEERVDQWLQALAAEFNLSETCYLTKLSDSVSDSALTSTLARFRLRWFTPVTEVELCGHATLAAAYTLYNSCLINSDIIEFSTLSGILTAKKVVDHVKAANGLDIPNGEAHDSYFIELNFPADPSSEFNSTEASTISNALGGASVIDILRTATLDYLLVVLTSGEVVAHLQPLFDAIEKCPGSGLIVTGIAPLEFEFDFISRFCPKFGINEVDAFTDSAFKGGTAAVCLLEEDRDDQWLQALAAEFNFPMTCYLSRLSESDHSPALTSTPRFSLRWFTTVAEVQLCGHATLAAAYVLHKYGLINSEIIEFSTLSGILTAKKVVDHVKGVKGLDIPNGEAQDSYFIELNFPADPSTEFSCAEVLAISNALGGASVLEIMRTANADNLLVVVPSGKIVVDLQPQLDAIEKCPGVGVIVTGIAPPESGFDFISRYFCPKFGVNEDPVCGSAHCALAPYWCKKLGKCDVVAYQASRRGGILNIHLDEPNQRVLLRGKAVAMMEGIVLI